ncbi:protein dopey-1 homolog [Halyomorpha halys]|uniref:protein dopey-1 homolog n=1 Tax=Halyomorpha halys TaxID=286706 RepID=UPI0006D4DF58|nr:protein dopey-1 homolog isoform X1 [Halyomorpha halys]XP_014273173.1 protein dopey-1 homolog isoform X1 [Halyomorpha halys]XP_024216432.1 protein dopey-1 homolog isoform X1 [Halyomorpha halys]
MMGTIAKEEEELMKDSKYKLYVSQIDKSLRNFEYSNEWADLIAALGKLNKVINNYAKYPVIPRRIKISKRLAQCMHPALPFGVHLKALETYDLIFKSMGTNRLSHELFIYSAGLFPLFGRAAMKVRPDLLKVYETHFVPLRARLRPALPGFLSGVLPGLEESSEYFSRTNALLENVCEGVGPSHFYGCIWDCLASNSCVRLPAISYILAHFDKKLPTEDQAHIMGNNIDVMVCGLIACIEDSSILVQRCALDLLIIGFPMHSCHMTNDDMIRLVTAALVTILRRDMSLNRRLYGWLLGSEVNMTLLSHHPQMRKAKAEKRNANYFDVFSKEMLVKAIKIILDNAIGKSPHDLKPYKLLVSLIDKDDIGPVIIDDILFEVFRLLYLCYNMDSKPNTSDLLKNANLLFGALVPRYLWEYVGQLFSIACSQYHGTSLSDKEENPVKRVGSGSPNIIEVCALAEFLLDIVSLETYTETSSEHLPSLFHHLVLQLTEHCDSLSAKQVAHGLKLCAKILTRVQPAIVGSHTSGSAVLDEELDSPQTTADSTSLDEEVPSDNLEKSDSVFEQCLRQYERFYVTFIYGTRLKVGETRSISLILESLRVKSFHSNWEEDVKQIDVILSLEGVNNNDQIISSISIELPRSKTPGEEWVEPMKVASRLLVDLSTLQTFFKSPQSKKMFETNVSAGDESNYTEFLPEWLRVLIACACWLPSAVPLQFVAISTLLDLIELCRTAQSLVQTSSEDVLTTVLILPLLSPPHLRFIEKHTYIFQIIARWLWNQLANLEYKLKCVELLYQLHSMLPSNDVVENCICNSLKGIGMTPDERLEAFRRFASLWHIGREINAKQGNSLRITDIFYKSMLKMLDNLKLPESDCLKVEAQNWLFHSLIRNDLPRILDPIFYILLDHPTARLSVLHIRAKTTDDINSTNTHEEHKNVYAVSSVNGTLVYHSDSKKKSTNKKGKHITAVTSMTNQSSKLNPKYVTEKNEENLQVYDNSKDKNVGQSISVYVNPLSANQPEINTDFDEYFEDTNGNEFPSESSDSAPKTVQTSTDTKTSGKKSSEQESAKIGFGINTALKISSLDLLNISDTIFTKVSDGEISKMHRGSFSSEGISTIISDETETSLVSVESSGMVRSWSFPGKDLDNNSDLEESAAAEEYFNGQNDDSMAVVEYILGDLLDRVVFLSGDLEVTTKPVKAQTKPKSQNRKLQYQPTITSHGSCTDPLHSHMLLYQKKFEADKILYALETLRNIIVHNPRLFLHYSSTTLLVSRSPILNALARHRKSLFGRGFYGDLDGGNIRTAMYLEVIMKTCLYFIRSFYHLEQHNITQKDIEGNKKVQICATDILRLVCSEMITFVKANGRSLSYYLADMFTRLKLYKIVLHCVLTSLTPVRTESGQLSHQVLKFNDGFDVNCQRLPMHSETLQIQLMRFLLSLLILEREISFHRTETSTGDRSADSLSDFRYINGRLIPEQPMFLAIVSRALEMQPYSRHTHSFWTSFVASSLPCLGNALTKVVTTVLKQICSNVEELSQCYAGKSSICFPPDYGITQVEAMTVLCHFCLLDSAFKNQPLVSFPGSCSSQIFNNLTNLIIPSPVVSLSAEVNDESLIMARKSVLGHLPRVIASSSVLWQALINRKEAEGENCEVGSGRIVKQQILDFLSPIAVHHSTSFLAAMAVVWRERRVPITPNTYTVIPNASDDQKVLVQLLTGIKAMPIDLIVQTLSQIVKQPAMDQEIAVSVEVSALELFVNYTQFVAAGSLCDSWPSFLQLLKESPSLSPPAQFLLLGALSQFVEKCPTFTDKKDLKDIQDITVKMVESCITVAGACLEQTTWLRRNLAVREEEPPVTPDREDKYYDDLESTEIESLITDESFMEEKPKKNRKSKLKRVTKKIRHDAEKLQISAMHDWFMKAIGNESNVSFESTERSKNGGNSVTQYSVGALTVLAQLLAPLLDVAFGNQEKERVVTLLINLMYNVTPYLRNHTPRNAGSYYACSQLLANLSSYQYTRKAWKKDAMELFFDLAFFQMELRSLQHWRVIVDNLMSQEDSTFRELMNRISVAPTNSLNIFSSKDQENEQRAQLLKRLAFVIYCSDTDQFCSHIKEIQERLSDCIKMPQIVPGLEAQVFLCLRVLLLRMTPAHIIPLWPTIISELVQVLMNIEEDLLSESEEMRKEYDGNGLLSMGWLQLQLAAANLLFLAVQLPADRLPQFQMYRWAFVGGDITSSNNSNASPDFVPHVTRIAQLMGKKYGKKLEALPTPLLPTCTKVKSLEDLYPFFTALSTGKYTPLSVTQLEHNLELDFLDVMPPGR